MNQPPSADPGDQARVSIAIKLAPPEAFTLFTAQIDQWWRRGLRYRIFGEQRGILHLEPFVGGRLFESIESEGKTKVFVSGQVLVWQPPDRLVFEWRAVNFAPQESTEVEVLFGENGSGTLVTVTHRGWAKIRADHPVRHNFDTRAFLRTMGMWWSDLLQAYQMHATCE